MSAVNQSVGAIRRRHPSARALRGAGATEGQPHQSSAFSFFAEGTQRLHGNQTPANTPSGVKTAYLQPNVMQLGLDDVQIK